MSLFWNDLSYKRISIVEIATVWGYNQVDTSVFSRNGFKMCFESVVGWALNLETLLRMKIYNGWIEYLNSWLKLYLGEGSIFFLRDGFCENKGLWRWSEKFFLSSIPCFFWGLAKLRFGEWFVCKLWYFLSLKEPFYGWKA